MMKRVLLVSLGMTLMAPAAWAARTAAHELADSTVYQEKMAGMLGRGVINVATCFVDMPVHLVHETQAGPPFIGTLVGIVKGGSCSAFRAASGALDLITFWVPGFNGFPVSDSYDDCLAVTARPVAAIPAAPAPPAALTPDPAWADTPHAPAPVVRDQTPPKPTKTPYTK